MFGTQAARKSGKAVSGLSAAQEETLGGDVDGANPWYPLQFIKILSGGSLKILRFSLHEHAHTWTLVTACPYTSRLLVRPDSLSGCAYVGLTLGLTFLAQSPPSGENVMEIEENVLGSSWPLTWELATGINGVSWCCRLVVLLETSDLSEPKPP